MTRLGWLFYCLSVIVLAGMAESIVAEEARERIPVEYYRDVRPILSDKCFRCHGPDGAQRQADLRLDRREEATSDREGRRAIVPGKPEESEVYRRITAADPDERMPPSNSTLTLSRREIELLRQWIEEGAGYQPHWSFIPPRSAPLPAVGQTTWPRNAIDYFIMAELQRHGLRPSPEASKPALLRRLTLDLTGLPPTVQELDTFLSDDSPGTYERAVDRLLGSPRFGERMAIDWLDAARYADTNGYYSDFARNAWPWRDWVMTAFNRNLPFDRFTVEQLAGDLLPDATIDERIATGFNRNHMVTNESGVIEEECRVGYVVDRVDTTTTVWLGLTVGCARCHDHKYDPITQHDYYGLFAYFNNQVEKGLVKDPINPPILSLPTPEQNRQLADLASRRTRCEASLKTAEPGLQEAMSTWEKRALDGIPAVPTSGSIAHFDFNRQGIDVGPSRLPVQTVGTLEYAAGVSGEAADFDATQYIEFADPPLTNNTPFSLCVWIKPGASPSGCVVSKMASTGDSRGFEIIWYKSQPRINLVHDWGRDAIEVVARQMFPSGEWRHLAITYDGSSRAAGLKVYVDGRLEPVTVRRDALAGSMATDEPWRIAWKGTGVGFEGGLDELRLHNRPLEAEEIETMYWRDMLGGAVETLKDKRTKQQHERLRTYYLAHEASEELRQLSGELIALRGEEEAARTAIVSSPVMQEMDQPRATHLLMRGQYDQPGPQVDPGIPAALGSLTADAPRNRLGLAEWLVSPANPLTARVAVNRYWQMVFGEGLVRTANDFGVQGETPSHPELLDWLAVYFTRSGWDVKGLMKLLVTSATYRQSSSFSSELLERDPDNRLLARGPRYRLPPESIRDQALALGGLLVERIGGPSVKPYQPTGLWEAVSYNGDQSYEQDHGEGLYRLSLYTFWKRQAPPPAMLIFDGPTREICTVRRARTITPLQALVLLNDVTYVEAARGLASCIMRAGGSDPAERVRYGFRRVTGRNPKDDEALALKSYYQQQFAVYCDRPQAAKALLQIGESPADSSLDPCELAAWTMTASVLLNLDEVITQH